MNFFTNKIIRNKQLDRFHIWARIELYQKWNLTVLLKKNPNHNAPLKIASFAPILLIFFYVGAVRFGQAVKMQIIFVFLVWYGWVSFESNGKDSFFETIRFEMKTETVSKSIGSVWFTLSTLKKENKAKNSTLRNDTDKIHKFKSQFVF